MYVMRLPGWEVLSREKIAALVRTTVGKLKGVNA
jgi:hypothetical protein